MIGKELNFCIRFKALIILWTVLIETVDTVTFHPVNLLFPFSIKRFHYKREAHLPTVKTRSPSVLKKIRGCVNIKALLAEIPQIWNQRLRDFALAPTEEISTKGGMWDIFFKTLKSHNIFSAVLI